MNGVLKGTYLYDGDGKRVKKISDLETTIFVYNGGGQLVAEYSTQQTATPQVSYLTADHLGSPRIITDNVGKVIARKDFNAFGDETASAQRTTALGYKPEEIRQDYTGYQKDDESGLEFAQARYYNGKHGRFTSVDPLTASANVKDPQTFNRYSYALNSPYKFTDPLGLLSVSTGACGQCQNVDRGGGGALTSGGSDNTFSDLFESMALNNAVDTALENLETYASGIGEGDAYVINEALKTMLTKGTAESKRIASSIVNSNVVIDVQSAANLGNVSARSGVNKPSELSTAIKADGTLTQAQALSYMFITIASSEIGNQESLEANLIHEGKHLEKLSAVVVSLSTGDPKKYQNETIYNDELSASRASTAYLKSKGGTHLAYGQELTYIDSKGNVDMNVMGNKATNAQNNFSKQGINNLQELLTHKGVTW